MEKYLYGRELLWQEIPQEVQLSITNKTLEIVVTPSHKKADGKIYCQRCRSPMTKVTRNACRCGQECGYCRQCINMGKVRQCDVFYSLPESNNFQLQGQESLLAWKGTLSQQQKEASENIIESIHNKETHLIWAVTGAGKTEMLFEGIEFALQHNYRVCIATPRVDVCLELMPRIKAAFPDVPLAVLYGAMEEPYQYTPLVLSTTHQLYRFREAFDVLIIDEVDAFPFHLDAALQFAAEKALKKEAALLYLTATPSRAFQKKIKENKLRATLLPARYHRHPLPVPVMTWCGDWRRALLKKPLKNKPDKKVKELIERGRRFLIFTPHIEWMLQLESHLRSCFPAVSFTSVSAEDSQRKEKVQAMRDKKLHFLITSTILERGVTFEDIDVLVIGAEDHIFTEAALVQIAGRCGRSAKYPAGEVLFFHHGKSLAMKKAVKQINRMNQLAKERGLVDG